MTPKERFYATVNNKPVDHPATWLGLPTPEAIPKLLEYFKVGSIAELKTKFKDDVWPVEVPYYNAPFNDIGCALSFAKESEGGTQDERTLTAPGYFENMTDPAEVEKYAWPNPADFFDADEALKRAKAIPEEDLRLGIMLSAHFQDSCSAFGMENALVTMMLYPDMYQAVIDRITEFYLEVNGMFYEATKGYLDAVLIGNDFGSQRSLMVDPDSLRKYVFPGTKKLEQFVNGNPKELNSELERLRSIFPTGLVISPSHEAILPDINPANVEALFNASKKEIV